MLNIHELKVTVEGKTILDGVSLGVGKGEVHAVMGPNGSGKTSLAHTLMGDPRYKVHETSSAQFAGKDLLEMPVDERARAGLYVAWQSPMTIPGLAVFTLCKTAYEALRQAQGKPGIVSVVEFRRKVEELLEKVGLTKDHLARNVNEGFSGGEKKRLEILQLLLLEPKLAVLDEIDSGLDVDALKMMGSIVEEMRQKGTAFILITHYKRLLEYVKPTHVHILKRGRIVKSGGHALVEEIEEKGYGSA